MAQSSGGGLNPIKTLSSATYNGQTNPYLINSGYTNNIFRGDVVAIKADGTIINLMDVGGTQAVAQWGVAPTLGVFMGCSFQTTSATNPIDPASPGRMYWPANTTTLNAVPAIAQVIDDPMVVYDCLALSVVAGPPYVVSLSSFIQSNMGSTGQLAIPYTGAIPTAVANGNTSTGTSLIGVNTGNLITTATFNVKLIRAVPGTYINSTNFTNAECVLQNHFYCQRPAGI